MTRCSFNQYQAGVGTYYHENKQHQRCGQAYMNYLAQVNKDLYHAVPWDLDPFYQDKFIPVFLHWLEQHWDLQD